MFRECFTTVLKGPCVTSQGPILRLIMWGVALDLKTDNTNLFNILTVHPKKKLLFTSDFAFETRHKASAYNSECYTSLRDATASVRGEPMSHAKAVWAYYIYNVSFERESVTRKY